MFNLSKSKYLWVIPATSLIFTLLLFLMGADRSHYYPLLITNLASFSFAMALDVLKKYLHSIGASLLVIFGSLCLLGFKFQFLAPTFYYLTLIILIAIYLKNISFKKKFSSFSFFPFLFYLLGAIAFTIILIERSEMGSAQPFMHLNIHTDTLYHTSIASMIKNYGITGTGLHGLTPPLHYHTGSHAIIAALSLISGLSVFDCYGYIYPLVLVPILLMVLLEIAEEFYPTNSPKESLFRIFIMIVLLQGLRNPIYMRGMFLPGYFISESYTISIVLILGLLSLLFSYEKSKNNIKLNFFYSFAIILLSALVTYSKVSSGLIYLCLLTAWAMLGKASNKYFRSLVTLGSFILFFILFKQVNSSTSDKLHLVFISQLRGVNITFLPPGTLLLLLQVVYFFIVHLLFTNVFFMGVATTLKKDQRFNLFSPWLLLGLLAATYVGIAPGLMIDFPSGTGFYFSNLSQIIVIPFLLILFSILLKPALEKKYQLIPYFSWPIFFIVIHFFLAFIPSFYLELRAFKFLANGIKKSKDNLYQNKYMETFLKISKDQNNKNLLIYIPKDETAFWNKETCLRAGFFITAFSERSSLLSLASPDCQAVNYGYEDYPQDLLIMAQKTYTDAELLSMSLNLGFKGVLMVRENGTRIITPPLPLGQ